MHRLVVAVTSLLVLVGVAVVAGYLFIFGAVTDRAAGFAPADSLAYASVYLTPSTGQQMRLGDILTRIPGFTDRNALGTKIDELAQRFLGGSGLDYRADVKPWLGDEVAVAVVRGGSAGQAGNTGSLVIAAVKDQQAAQAAIGRIVAKANGTSTTESYQGVAITVAHGGSGQSGAFAIVGAMLLAGSDAGPVHAAIDLSLIHI